ncbi:MAG: hypothetical protein E3K37_17555 [Candidatus Kuenenia sp.]|nr:hypothetical protein [Candidatus Kuenenia hertensis]
MVTVSDSVIIQSNYRPAWNYAKLAVNWLKKTSESGETPNHIDSESCFLSFLFSSLCLEAIIAQFLTDESSQNNDDLLNTRTDLLKRWRDGVQRLCTGSAKSKTAVISILNLCREKNTYGLLVRSRNKLIHPRAYTEVIDDSGHCILEGSVSSFVSDLKAANPGLPESKPAFPQIVKCRPAALWVAQTMKEMVKLLYQVREKPLEDIWNEVLQEI